MEKMISKLLMWYVEKNGLISQSSRFLVKSRNNTRPFTLRITFLQNYFQQWARYLLKLTL